MKSGYEVRLNVVESHNVKFGRTIIAYYKGQKLSPLDAMIASIKTGTSIRLYTNEGPLSLVIGMLDMHSEPWNKKMPTFYGYQTTGTTLAVEKDIEVMWIGEITSNPRQMVLRELADNVIPASTEYVGTMQTMWEMRTGFMDGIVNHKNESSFDVVAAALKTVSTIQVETSKLIAGLGYARVGYDPAYLPVQLERMHPWQYSEAIWPRHGEKDEEPNRRLYHGGYALLNWSTEKEPNKYYAFPAAGYFFTMDGVGGSFKHDGPTPAYTFKDQTFEGLLPVS